MKQDIAELRYKGRILKFEILYNADTEEIIPLFKMHDVVAVQHNRNKTYHIKLKVNPKSKAEEVYLFPFSDFSNKKSK